MSDRIIVELVERDIVAFEKTHHQYQVHPIVKLKTNKQRKKYYKKVNKYYKMVKTFINTR